MVAKSVLWVWAAASLSEALFFDGFPEGPDTGPWLEDRLPLLIAAVGVLALLAFATVQAMSVRRQRRNSSSIRPREPDGRLAWFRTVALGLGIAGTVLWAYAVFWSLREGGALHVVERRTAVVLLTGSELLHGLFEWASRRKTSRGRGRF